MNLFAAIDPLPTPPVAPKVLATHADACAHIHIHAYAYAYAYAYAGAVAGAPSLSHRRPWGSQ